MEQRVQWPFKLSRAREAHKHTSFGLCVKRKNMCHTLTCSIKIKAHSSSPSPRHGHATQAEAEHGRKKTKNRGKKWAKWWCLPVAEMHRASWMCSISSNMYWPHAVVCHWRCTKSVGPRTVWPLSLDCRRAIAPLWICCVNERLHYRFVPLVPWNSPSVHPVTYTCWLIDLSANTIYKWKMLFLFFFFRFLILVFASLNS